MNTTCSAIGLPPEVDCVPQLQPNSSDWIEFINQRHAQFLALGFTQSVPPALNSDWGGNPNNQRFYRMQKGAAIYHVGYDMATCACILTTSGLGRTFTDWLGHLKNGYALFGKMLGMGWIEARPTA